MRVLERGVSFFTSMKVHRFVSNDFTIRIAAVDATAVIAEMQKLQDTFPLATLGVGRAMVGALLMASHLKEGQEVGILLKGNGPLGSIYAQASFEGQVRGYCPYPHYQSPEPEDVLNLSKAMGFGQLTVTRQQPFQKSPHFGTVDMVTGEVGDDIAHYLHQSHQIRSVVSLGVYLDQFGKVQSGGGVLIEVMPGVGESVVEKIQANMKKVKDSISQKILSGTGPKDLVAPYLEGIPFTQIPHEHSIKYHCPCTSDRVLRALGLLGDGGLQEIIDEGQDTEVICQMCGRKYSVSTEEIAELQSELRKSSLH